MKTETQDHPYGKAVAKLIEEFGNLPGIGRKSAERLANHILSSSSDEANALAEAIRNVKISVKRCAMCFNLTEDPLCRICRDSRRDQHVVCVVEQPKDVVALESSGAFSGVYHVLGGRIAPLDGVGPEDLSCVEVHDAAAPAELMIYEYIGLAKPGEGPALLQSGETRLGGKRPVNTSGGLLAKGHPVGATGIAQICEATWQLRGQAGARQVPGARLALTQNGGGWLDDDSAAMSVHILEAVR